MPTSPSLDTAAPAEGAPPADSPATPWTTSDHKADIDKFFAEDDAKSGKPPEGELPLETDAPPPEKKEAAAPVKRTGIMDKMVERSAPPAKEEKKEEPPPPVDPVDEIEQQMQKANPKWKSNDGWTKLKTIAKTESQKRAELEQRLVETEAKIKALPVAEGLTSDDLKKLREEHKTFSDRLLLTDLQSHPQFRAQFVEPRDAEIGRAKELLQAHGINTDVATLLAKPRAELGKAVEELTKDLPSFDRTEISEAVRKAYAIEQNSRVALGNAKELQKNIQQQTRERQRSNFEKFFAPAQEVIKKNIEAFEAPADATPEERAEYESYVKGAQEIKAKAEHYAFAVSDDQQAAEVAMKAAAYDFHVGTVQPKMVKEYASVMADNRRMAQELKALHSRNPNRKITPNSARTDTEPKSMAEMSHSEAADHIARGGT